MHGGIYTRFFSASNAMAIEALLIDIKAAGKSALDFTPSGAGLGVIQENHLATLTQLAEPLKTLAQTEIIADAAQMTTFASDHAEAIEKITSLALMSSARPGNLVNFITSNRGANIAIAEINQPFPINFQILATLALAKITDGVVTQAMLHTSLLALIEAGNSAFVKGTITALIKAEKLDAAAWAEAVGQQLILAVHGGRADKVRALLDAHANPDTKDKEGRTMLIKTCWVGEIHTPDQVQSRSLGQTQSLTSSEYEALRVSKLEIVRALLAADANPNIRDAKGQTALMMACMYNQIDLVRALLEARADIMLRDSRGKTALDYADNAALDYRDKAVGIRRILTAHAAKLPEGTAATSATALYDAQAGSASTAMASAPAAPFNNCTCC